MYSGFGAAASRRLFARDRQACSDECCPKSRAGCNSCRSIHSHTCTESGCQAGYTSKNVREVRLFELSQRPPDASSVHR